MAVAFVCELIHPQLTELGLTGNTMNLGWQAQINDPNFREWLESARTQFSRTFSQTSGASAITPLLANPLEIEGQPEPGQIPGLKAAHLYLLSLRLIYSLEPNLEETLNKMRDSVLLGFGNRPHIGFHDAEQRDHDDFRITRTYAIILTRPGDNPEFETYEFIQHLREAVHESAHVLFRLMLNPPIKDKGGNVITSSRTSLLDVLEEVVAYSFDHVAFMQILHALPPADPLVPVIRKMLGSSIKITRDLWEIDQKDEAEELSIRTAQEGISSIKGATRQQILEDAATLPEKIPSDEYLNYILAHDLLRLFYSKGWRIADLPEFTEQIRQYCKTNNIDLRNIRREVDPSEFERHMQAISALVPSPK